MGTCGEDAALRLSRAGLEVVGVEANLIGGECPYWACLPTKSLVRSANLLTEARRADGLVGEVSVKPDWSIVAERLRAEITGGWNDAGGVGRFEALGGRFVRGWGQVVGPKTVKVDGETIVAKRGILVATGSTAFIPPISGLRDLPYWTNREAIETEALPESLIVIGGGPIGCEFAQIFARFGSRVTIVEASERLLPQAEPEASALVAESFELDDINLITGRQVESALVNNSSLSMSLSDGQMLSAERVLVAVGRQGTAEGLGLESTGATVSGGFVDVDGRMRASEGVWAIGDVTGPPLLTQIAEYQSRIAVEDILGAQPSDADYTAVPVATFTDPEVASVGFTESQARDLEIDVVVQQKNLPATFRGWLHRIGNSGLIKLVATGDNKLIGATVVGPNASEIIGFLHLAVARGISLDELVDLVYPFPSFYGGVGETLGAYGRGITRVLDPDNPPMFDDPTDSG